MKAPGCDQLQNIPGKKGSSQMLRSNPSSGKNTPQRHPRFPQEKAELDKRRASGKRMDGEVQLQPEAQPSLQTKSRSSSTVLLLHQVLLVCPFFCMLGSSRHGDLNVEMHMALGIATGLSLPLSIFGPLGLSKIR